MILEIIGDRGEVMTSVIVDDPRQKIVFPPIEQSGCALYVVADGKIIHYFQDQVWVNMDKGNVMILSNGLNITVEAE